MPLAPHTLEISRFIAAPPAMVWQAWTTPSLLAQWWIPAPLQCRVVTLDLRPGGGFVTQMREAGAEFTPHVDGCFLDVVENQRLVFTTALLAGWQPCDPWLAITATMTFQAEANGTRYTATALHKSAEEATKHDDLGFQDGWGAAIDQLAALLARQA